MTRLKIKNWGVAHQYAPEFDLNTGPSNLSDFCLDLRIDVEEEGKEGVIAYQLFVCTPSGLATNFDDIANHIAVFAGGSNSYILGKGLLILLRYDIGVIEKAIEESLGDLYKYAIDMS